MSTGFSARVAGAARWLIVAVIAYTLAGTVQYFAAGSDAPPAHARQLGRAPEVAVSAVATLRSIQAKNLFGALEPVEAPARELPMTARPTGLALQLQGVFVADVAEASAAIVSMPNRRGLLYSVGDTLPGDVELVAVLSDHVVLSNGGVRETLAFPAAGDRAAAPGAVGVTGMVTGWTDEIPPLQPVSTVDEHPDRWKPGFSTVLGMVPPGADEDDD